MGAATCESEVVDAGRAAAPLIGTRGLTKAFGPLEALSDIDLAFYEGRLNACPRHAIHICPQGGAMADRQGGHVNGILRYDSAPLAIIM